MAGKYQVAGSALTNIANAIREKGGTSAPLIFPNEFISAIGDIEGGGSADLGTKNIINNGTYDASDDSLDGYSEVTVNVPNSYVAGDEGKVVHNGALVAQTSTTKTVNGTYDTTTNNSITINVPASGVLAHWDFTGSGSWASKQLDPDNPSLKAQFVPGPYAEYPATVDTDGFHFTHNGQYIKLPLVAIGYARTIEIDIGDVAETYTNGLFLIGFDDNDDDITHWYGFCYDDYYDRWEFYQGSNIYTLDSAITGFDYFENSTLKFCLDTEGHFSIYKNNDKIFESNVILDSVCFAAPILIGNKADCLDGYTIEAVRIR